MGAQRSPTPCVAFARLACSLINASSVVPPGLLKAAWFDVQALRSVCPAGSWSGQCELQCFLFLGPEGPHMPCDSPSLACSPQPDMKPRAQQQVALCGQNVNSHLHAAAPSSPALQGLRTPPEAGCNSHRSAHRLSPLTVPARTAPRATRCQQGLCCWGVTLLSRLLPLHASALSSDALCCVWYMPPLRLCQACSGQPAERQERSCLRRHCCQSANVRRFIDTLHATSIYSCPCPTCCSCVSSTS